MFEGGVCHIGTKEGVEPYNPLPLPARGEDNRDFIDRGETWIPYEVPEYEREGLCVTSLHDAETSLSPFAKNVELSVENFEESRLSLCGNSGDTFDMDENGMTLCGDDLVEEGQIIENQHESSSPDTLVLEFQGFAHWVDFFFF
jgi:hypothetical protein